MTVKVVPLEAIQGTLKFDLILETGHVTTLTVGEYEIRHYRSASIAEVIEQKVLDWLAQNDYETDSISIVFL
jgi:uncharacterized protein YqiB (DUF1249 family)